jgi:hypothetical protein
MAIRKKPPILKFIPGQEGKAGKISIPKKLKTGGQLSSSQRPHFTTMDG